MKSVLIIDDEEDLCALLKKVLQKDMLEVDCVHRLDDAELKMNTHFDIILLDNNLPDGSGLEFYQRHRLKFKGSSVVFISADPNATLLDGITHSGMAAVIKKPFSTLTLRNAIRQIS